MAYDGIVTYGIVKELNERLKLAKIEKIYQPGKDDIILQLHTKNGNVKLLGSCGSMSARLCLTENKYENPVKPPNFCMLLRKHLQGGRITEIRQHGSDRVAEIDIEAQTELGFNVSRRLIFEIMGKHSNIILIDVETGKILDACKHISIDVNRYRQLLPGIIYKYPPEQDKIPFKGVTRSMEFDHVPKNLLARISGISPAVAREIAAADNPAVRLDEITASVDTGTFRARIYFDGETPKEFHLTDLREYEGLDVRYFDTLNECAEYFYSHRETSNLVKQKSVPLHKIVKTALDKALLKKQRLSDDLLRAENSDKYRLWGELLTANLHLLHGGEKEVTVTNYYDGSEITIKLDPKLSPSGNSQRYYKKYNKAKTAVKEKQIQLEETNSDIAYLDSVLLSVENADTVEELDDIREELQESGYIRHSGRRDAPKRRKANLKPDEYHLSNGMTALVGRNNKGNDYLTTKMARKTDLWLHTKDIPGSHVIIRLPDGVTADDLDADTIYEAAALAAYHSKARQSSNVPVDYVAVRHVHKPAGAKPGMVIFTDNRTVYVDPKEAAR